MRRLIRYVRPGSGVLLFALALGAAPARPGDTQQPPARPTDGERDAVARQIRQRVEQIQAARNQYLGERDANRRRLDEVRRQIQRLEDDRDTVTAEAGPVREQVAAAEKDLAARRQRAEEARTALAAAAADALPAVRHMAVRVESGIPYRRAERLKALRGVEAGLASEDPLARAAAVESLWTWAGDELRLMRTTEMWNQPVDLPDGRQVHAYQVRLGLVNQLFAGEQEQAAGLAAKEPGRAWRTDLGDAATRQVLGAVDVLRQRRPPQVTPVPLVVAAPDDRAGGPAANGSTRPARTAGADQVGDSK